MIRVRTVYTHGATLAVSMERLTDLTFYDFGIALAFVAPRPAAVTPTQDMTEGSGIWQCSYSANINPTPIGQFTNNGYAIYVHDMIAGKVVGMGFVTTFNGDDQTEVTVVSGAGFDAVIVEPAVAGTPGQPAINARQALSLILSLAGAGLLSGADSGPITTTNPAGTANRVQMPCDQDGNRIGPVVLTPPA